MHMSPLFEGEQAGLYAQRSPGPRAVFEKRSKSGRLRALPDGWRELESPFALARGRLFRAAPRRLRMMSVGRSRKKSLQIAAIG